MQRKAVESFGGLWETLDPQAGGAAVDATLLGDLVEDLETIEATHEESEAELATVLRGLRDAIGAPAGHALQPAGDLAALVARLSELPGGAVAFSANPELELAEESARLAEQEREARDGPQVASARARPRRGSWGATSCTTGSSPPSSPVPAGRWSEACAGTSWTGAGRAVTPRPPSIAGTSSPGEQESCARLSRASGRSCRTSPRCSRSAGRGSSSGSSASRSCSRRTERESRAAWSRSRTSCA